MPSAAPLPSVPPVFIFERGPTAAQQAWLDRSTAPEQAAFIVSAPVRLYVSYLLLANGTALHRFTPTVHGIPVGVLCATPAEALQDGLTCQTGALVDLLGRELPLDLDALKLRFETEEFESLDTHDQQYFGRPVAGGPRPTPVFLEEVLRDH